LNVAVVFLHEQVQEVPVLAFTGGVLKSEEEDQQFFFKSQVVSIMEEPSEGA